MKMKYRGCVSTACSCAVWSVANSCAGSSAFRSAGRDHRGGTGDRDVGTREKLTAAAALLKQEVKDLGLPEIVRNIVVFSLRPFYPSRVTTP